MARGRLLEEGSKQSRLPWAMLAALAVFGVIWVAAGDLVPTGYSTPPVHALVLVLVVEAIGYVEGLGVMHFVRRFLGQPGRVVGRLKVLYATGLVSVCVLGLVAFHLLLSVDAKTTPQHLALGFALGTAIGAAMSVRAVVKQ